MASHIKKHSIVDILDHTGLGGAVQDNIIAFDANGLPGVDSGIAKGNIFLRDGSLATTASITIGIGAIGIDYAINFDGESNDGSLTWMEDETRFDFSSDIQLNGDISFVSDNQGIDFGASQDSGITDNGAGLIFDCDLLTAGSRYFHFLNGDVGIGLDIGDNPTEKLHIHGSSSGSVKIRVTNDDTGKTAGDGLSFGLTANENVFFENHENTYMYFATNGTERMRIQADGDVSILNSVVIGSTGADNPASLLEIYSSTAHPILTITGAHATDYDPQIQFKTDASPTVKWSVGVDSTDDFLRLVAGTGMSNTGMVVDGSGNVGILGVPDTATAVNALTIHGEIAKIRGTGTIGFSLQNEITGYVAGAGLTFGIDGAAVVIFNNAENTNMRFLTNATQRMIIKNSGNVAIGNTFVADTLLHVHGGIKHESASASAISINLQSGYDTHYNYIEWRKSTGSTRGAYMGYGTPGTFIGLYLEDGNDFRIIGGGLFITSDSEYLKLGTGSDCGIMYNGTNMIIDSDLVGAGSLYIGGDGTNYAEFKPDGEIILHGTARVTKKKWIDVDGFRAPGVKPATKVDYGIGSAWEFTDGTDDTIIGRKNIPDDMDRSVGFTVMIGWSTPTANAGNCKWDVEYLFRKANEAMDAAADATITNTVAASATAKGLVMSEIDTTALPDADDGVITLRIKRRADEAADTLGEDNHLFGVGLKYTVNKIGAAT